MVLFALAGFLSDWFKGSAGETRSRAVRQSFARAGGLWRDDRPGRAGRGRDGRDLAAHRAPHLAGDGMMRRHRGGDWRYDRPMGCEMAAPTARQALRARRPLRRLARGVLLAVVVLLALFGGGFVWFVWHVPADGSGARPQRRRHRGAHRRRLAHLRRDRTARRRARQAPADQRRASRDQRRPRSRASIRATRGSSPAASISTIRRSTRSATRSRRGAGRATAASPR